jgi:hypothetical protein
LFEQSCAVRRGEGDILLLMLFCTEVILAKREISCSRNTLKCGQKGEGGGGGVLALNAVSTEVTPHTIHRFPLSIYTVPKIEHQQTVSPPGTAMMRWACTSWACLVCQDEDICRDENGRLWATTLCGPVGFMQVGFRVYVSCTLPRSVFYKLSHIAMHAQH